MLAYHMATGLKVTVPWHSPMLHHIPVLLGFVSGSWVFLSGVIVAHYYQSKFALSPFAVTRRLWIRGAKLLFIFITLNYLVYLLGMKPGVRFDLDVLAEIFGRGGGYLSSFEILIGIAYVLIAAPVILALRGFGTALLLALCLAAVARNFLGHSIEPNYWSIMLGFLGILSIQVAEKLKSTVIKEYVFNDRILSIILLFLLIILIILSWLFKYGKHDFSWYFTVVITVNWFIYVIYSQIKIPDSMDIFIRSLGRHSLIGYLSQMLIIWTILTGFKYFNLNSIVMIFLYSIVSILIFLLFMRTYDYTHTRFRFVRSVDDFFFR